MQEQNKSQILRKILLNQNIIVLLLNYWQLRLFWSCIT